MSEEVVGQVGALVEIDPGVKGLSPESESLQNVGMGVRVGVRDGGGVVDTMVRECVWVDVS